MIEDKCNLERLKELAEQLSTNVVVTSENNKCKICPLPEYQLPCNCPIQIISSKIEFLESKLTDSSIEERIKLYEDIFSCIKGLVHRTEVGYES